MSTFRLTNASIKERCLPPPPDAKTKSGKPVLQKVYMDSDLKGFMVVVTRNKIAPDLPTRTFFAQREVNGRSARVKIARVGDISADEARRRALVLVGEMTKGVNPNAEKKRLKDRGITLDTAATMFRDKPSKRNGRPRAPRTVKYYDYLCDILSEWKKRPLSEISRVEVLNKYNHLVEERGQTTAAHAMKWFQAVYYFAQTVYETLPANPCVVLSEYWPAKRRKRQPIPWSGLPEWGLWVEGPLRELNPVKADLQIFTLFTGLRTLDARMTKINEVSIAEMKLLRPAPKGGEDRAFDVPLSDFLIEHILRRIADTTREFGADCPWLFPTFGKKPRELTYLRDPYEKGRPTPHRLRDTYLTAAHEAGVLPLDQKILANHFIPMGDETEGYQRPSWEHLIKQQQKVSRYLLEKLGRPNLPQMISAIPLAAPQDFGCQR